MELRDRIAAWAGWTGWRRFAPAGGSLATHVVMAVAAVSLLAASTKPKPSLPVPPPSSLQVMLIAETPPPMRQPPAPLKAPQASDPKGESLPIAPRKDPRKNLKQETQPQDDSVYIPPSVLAELNVPPGLRGAVESDPCKPKYGVRQKDCVTGWTAKLGAIDTVSPRPQQELQRYYAEFMPACAWRVGCNPDNGVLPNGAHSVFSRYGSPMMGGAGGLSGMNSTVERLQFDQDHRDPGFGD